VNSKYLKSSHVVVKQCNDHAVIYHRHLGNAVTVGKKVVQLLELAARGIDARGASRVFGERADGILRILQSLHERGFLRRAQEPERDLDDIALSRYPDRVLRLYITEMCNMACTYCFERLKKSPRTMEPSLVLSAARAYCKWLLAQKDQDFDRLKVNYFGGEPMLEFSVLWQTEREIRRALEPYRDRLRVTMNTNGTLITGDAAKWLVDNTVHVFISIDGTRQTHDQQRLMAGGGGSFDRVIKGVQALLDEADGAYIDECLTVLCTITPKNVAELNSIATYFKHLGVRNISFNPAFNCTHSPVSSEWTSLDRPQMEMFIRTVIDLQAELLREHVHVGGSWGFIPERLRSGGSVFCQAAGHEVGVAADGMLFPCPCVFGDSRHSIGRLTADESFEMTPEYDRWAGRTSRRMEQCRDCPIACVCRGGCAGVNCLRDRELYEPLQCEFWKMFVDSYLQTAPVSTPGRGM